MNINLTEVITAAKVARLWRLKSGTVRRACREGRVDARQSARTWLTTKSGMFRAYGEMPTKHEVDYVVRIGGNTK